MKVWMVKILDYVFVVFSAFLFLQFPLFMHQYKHQLVGHVEELKWQIDTMHIAALRSEKTVDQYIQKFIDHEDKDFSFQGLTMKRVYSRFTKLSNTLFRLQNASIITRPFVFLFNFQGDIFKSTLKSFVPGFALTFESFLYALFGIVKGIFLSRILSLLYRKFILLKRPVEIKND